VINGKRYYTLPSSRNYQEQGIASWYGAEFDGRLTSSREPYDMYALTAAHRTLPLPTYVEVKNLENGRTVVLRVNDRGPFHEERLLDLSFMAASRLGILEKGTGRVEVRALTSPEPSPYQASRNGTPRGNLYLQAGAFSQRANAEQLRKQLRSVTDTAVEINEVQRGDQVVYRVRLGPLPPDEPPYQLLTTLNSVGFKDPKIVAE
jgi:rare lipoprotein A